MAQFTANVRVPTRPLSYANKDMAYNKELLVDYTTGLIYVVDENGNIIDVTTQVYNKIVASGTFDSDSITVTVPNPNNTSENIDISIQNETLQILKDIDAINSNLSSIQSSITSMKSDISTNKANISSAETAAANAKSKATSAYVVTESSPITISHSSISGTTAPYQLSVYCSGLNPASNYPAPILDISFISSSYSEQEKEEDAFFTIYRCTITSVNYATLYFREKPTIDFKVRFIIFSPNT